MSYKFSEMVKNHINFNIDNINYYKMYYKYFKLFNVKSSP